MTRFVFALLLLLAACSESELPREPPYVCTVYRDGQPVATTRAVGVTSDVRGLGAPCIHAYSVPKKQITTQIATICGDEIAIVCDGGPAIVLPVEAAP